MCVVKNAFSPQVFPSIPLLIAGNLSQTLASINKIKLLMSIRRIITEFSEEEFTEIIRRELRNADVHVQNQRRLDKRFYPLSWLVEYTGIPKNTVYQMTSKNKIPHFKRGRKLFFEKTLIDKWLEDGWVKSDAEIKNEAEKYLTQKGRRRYGS